MKLFLHFRKGIGDEDNASIHLKNKQGNLKRQTSIMSKKILSVFE